MTINKAVRGAAVALALAASPVSAATYTYTGNNFVNFGGDTPNIFSTANQVSGYFETANALFPNQTLQSVTPTFFTFSTGVTNIASGGATFVLFEIGTDATGNINSWKISLIASLLAYSDIFTNNSPASVVDSASFVARSTCGALGCSGNVSDNPGSWQRTDVAAVPLPAALPLFAAGLGAIGVMSRRKKRKAAVAD